MKRKLIYALALITCVIIACKKDKLTDANTNYSDVPVLPDVPYHYSATTNDKTVALGRVLFFDNKLSLNNSVACGSCHQQARAFCDNKQFSTGFVDTKTARNTPSIFAKGGHMFWDGRATDINDLVLRPIKNHVEMHIATMEQLSTKLSKTSYYPALFNDAFGSTVIDSAKIQIALSSFIHNFTFSNNKFNASLNNPSVLNASENLGKDLFFGKAKCANCHRIKSSTNTIGFPGGPPTGNNGYGNTEGPIETVSFNIGLDNAYTDNGVGNITKASTDNGKFVIPVLLNVEYTAPYMHDGRFKTLEEVVEHYNSGIKNHPNLDAKLRDVSSFENLTEVEQEQQLVVLDTNHDGDITTDELSSFPTQKLNLTVVEKKNLVDFLKTLSDPSILVDKRFSTPFKR
jgi:cytochrome c peroxidase